MLIEAVMHPTFDGTKLYLKRNLIEQPKGAILVVHGLCEHLDRYDELTEKWNNRGFNVYRFEHRGHARSEGKRTYFQDFHELAEDVNVFIDIAIQENPDLPVFLLGHSMGGLASSLFATKYPGKVKGVLLSGALTRYNRPIAGELPIDMPAETYIPNILGDGVCSDPKVVTAYKNDPLVEKEITVGLFNTLHYGIQWLKENASSFVDPVFFMHGADDGLVSERDSRDSFGEIASKDKSLKIYAGLMHEIFNEPSRLEVIEESIAWAEKRI